MVVLTKLSPFLRSRWSSYIQQARSLTTGLYSTFNRPNQMLAESEQRRHDIPAETGLFNHVTLNDPNGFYLFRENAILQAERLVSEAIDRDTRKRKMVEIFDELSNCLCKCADLAEFVRVGHPTYKFQQNAQQCSQIISAEVERLNQNTYLYNELKLVVEKGDHVEGETEMDKHVANLFLQDFEQSGIHMEEDYRKEALRMQELIQHVGTFFVANSHEPRRIPKSKLPPELQNAFGTLSDMTEVSSLHPDSDSEFIREAAYRIFLFPDDHQEQLLQRLLVARNQLATLCGFPSYAHRAINGSILEKPETVRLFIDEVSDMLRPLADQDYEAMFKLKNEKVSSDKKSPVRPWDTAYFTAAIKKSEYSRDVEKCLPYFSLGACMDGLNLVFDALYGATLRVEETVPGETWHGDVVKLAILQNDTVMGHVYCDFWERQGKLNQDCHYTIQGGCQLKDGSMQRPIVVLMLSLPRPAIGQPTLLSPHMVDNLFHEMGHAMHSMLGQTRYQHVTGTRCSTDLAEVPSILMEYLCSDERIVKKFARHHASGEVIPDKLLNAWIKSKKVFNASDTQLQVFYSALDQAYHSERPLMGLQDTTEVLQTVHETYYGLPYVPNTAWQFRFGHLFGYGAKYYSYLVSRSIAAAVWRDVFAADPLSRAAGDKFHRDCLSHGGGVPPRDVAKLLLGGGPEKITPTSLAKSLIEDVMTYSSTSFDKRYIPVSKSTKELPQS